MAEINVVPRSDWAVKRVWDRYRERNAGCIMALAMGVVLSFFCVMLSLTGGPWETWNTWFTISPMAIALLLAGLGFAVGTARAKRYAEEVGMVNETDYALAQQLRRHVQTMVEMVAGGKMVDRPTDGGWQLAHLESFRDWNLGGGWSGSFGGLFSRSGGGSWWGTATPDLMHQSVVAHFRRGDTREVVQAIVPSVESVIQSCTKRIADYLTQRNLPDFVRWPNAHTGKMLFQLRDSLGHLDRSLDQVRIANELQLEQGGNGSSRTYKLTLSEIRPGQAWLIAMATPEGKTLVASPINVTDVLQRHIVPLLPKPTGVSSDWSW